MKAKKEGVKKKRIERKIGSETRQKSYGECFQTGTYKFLGEKNIWFFIFKNKK